jgi:hypothetical protein
MLTPGRFNSHVRSYFAENVRLPGALELQVRQQGEDLKLGRVDAAIFEMGYCDGFEVYVQWVN